MSGVFGASNTQGDLSKDIAVKDPPEDSISEISFHPKANFLSVASWDQKLRIYEIDNQGQSAGKAMIQFEAPVLSTAWSVVCLLKITCSNIANMIRTAQKLSAAVLIKQLACST
jgi:WD40 repeat protein